MALLKDKLNQKWKASTIIEVVIASVIILVSFTAAIRILSGLAGDNDVLRKLSAGNYINAQFSGSKGEVTRNNISEQTYLTEEDKGDGLVNQIWIWKVDSASVGKGLKRRRILKKDE